MNITEAVAYNVRRFRKARELTTQALEQRLAGIGHRIARSSIANMEMGRREASVEDIAALAIALQVPPILLIVPLASEPTMTVLGREVDTWDVAQWFAGRAPLEAIDADFQAFLRGSAAIDLNARHDDLVDLYRLALAALRRPRKDQVDIEHRVDVALLELVDVRSEMRRHGFPLPNLPEGMKHVDDHEVVRTIDPRGPLTYSRMRRRLTEDA